LASKLTQEAKSLAEEGKDRIGHLRHRDDLEFSAQEEITRLREELAQLREQSTRGRGAGKELSALASKLTRSSGLEPNSAAADALAAGLDHLERTLKARAPELLAAKDRRHVAALLQSELGPVLRDSLMQAASAAFSSWEAARRATPDLPKPKSQALKSVVADAPRQLSRVIHRSEQERGHESTTNADRSVDVARQLLGLSEAEGADSPGSEKETAATEPAERGSIEATSKTDREHEAGEHQRKAGWLWAAAGLGLGIYALADHDRREQFLKFANEATVLTQELLRDLQGYDDEFA
jgi:hypothetical protein